MGEEAPPLPAPDQPPGSVASSECPSDAEAEQHTEPLLEPPSKNIKTFKTFVKVVVGGESRKFENKIYCPPGEDLALWACQLFEREANNMLADFDRMSRRPTDRAALLEAAGCDSKFFSSGRRVPVAEQKQALVRQLCRGGVQCVEQKVLDCLVKLVCRDVNTSLWVIKPTKTGFAASFAGKGEAIEKAFDKLSQAILWLKSMNVAEKEMCYCFEYSKYIYIQYSILHYNVQHYNVQHCSFDVFSCVSGSKSLQIEYVCHQDGSLTKSMKTLTTNAKETVHANDAILALQAAASKTVLPKLIEPMGSKTCDMSQVRDITADFMAPSVPSDAGMEVSEIFVYRGIVKRLAGMSAKQVGVLAGLDKRVQDVLLGSSVDEVIHNETVEERWRSLHYEVMGLVVWCDVGKEDPSEYKEQFNVLKSEKPLLLLVFHGKPDPAAWVTECDGVKVSSFKRVLLDSKGNRKKDDQYIVMQANLVATTFLDQAWRGQTYWQLL